MRRRSLGSYTRIVGSLVGRSNSGRLVRLGSVGFIAAVTLIGSTGPVDVSGRALSTSPSVVQSFGGALDTASGQLIAAPTVATSSGDLLVLVVEVRDLTSISTVKSVSDSGHNSWVKAAAAHTGKTDEEMWYVVNATVITSTGRVDVVVTSPSAMAMTVIELRGTATSRPLDVTATNSGISATPSTGATASTRDASEIVVADIGWATGVKLSGQTAGYSLLAAEQSKVSGDATGEQAGAQILSTTGTQRFAAALSASVSWTGIIATFEAASALPTPTPSATATPSATPTMTPTPTPTASPIQHVVVIYHENHSFDEVLGDWCHTTSRCNGIDVSQPITLESGQQMSLQASPDVVPNVTHSVASQVYAMDAGRMDGWAGIQGCGSTSTLVGAIPYGCLTYYAPAQIPNLVSLATTFTVSDRTFSMADSPSWGGHLYSVAATTDHFTGDNPGPPNTPPSGWTQGPGWGCDSNDITTWIDPATGASSRQPSCIPDPALGLPNGGAFEPTPAQYVPTIMDRLDQAGLSWHFYTALSAESGYIWAVCPSFAECLDTKQSQSMVPTQQVLSDATAGTLPAYSLVLGGGGAYGGLVQHNQMSMAKGDNWIGQVVSAIENGPDWSSTAIFITYDDCGCFYDHVPPGINPDGTQQGIRVPMVIVSPYAKAGFTDSTPASFASILAFVERNFGLAPLGVNDAAAYPFSNAFDYSQSPLAGIAMRQEAIPLAEQQYLATHPSNPDDPT